MTDTVATRAQGSESIDAGEIIDRAPVAGFQRRMLAIVALVMVLEGFDIQCISFVAPAIVKEWGVEPAAFGAVFSLGLVGALIGAAVLGPLGDRFGRKPIIVINVLLFAIGTAATPLAWDVTSLAAIRFLTSLGLGGVTPNAIALISEYAPARARALFVAIVATSPLAGGMIGGIVSREIILTVGWEWVFYGAGIVSLLILIPVAGLPESVRYLIAAGKRDELVGQIMRRIDPALPASPDTRYRVSTIDQQASRLRDLFGPGLAGTTLLLWIGVAANLFMTVLLIYWLPLLLEQQGVPLGTAIIATSILNGAGILGGITLAFLADRIGAPRVIVVASFAATVVVVLIGAVAPDMPATMIFVFLAGFLGLGSYAGFNVVSASVYPVRIRSAGVGWALSIGKTGAAAGPFAASTALEMQMPMSGIYAIAASAGLVAAAAILAISLRRRPEAPA